MTTYLLLNNQRIELSEDYGILEEGKKVFIEENGVRKPYIVESIVTILRKTNNVCDPPIGEVTLHG